MIPLNQRLGRFDDDIGRYWLIQAQGLIRKSSIGLSLKETHVVHIKWRLSVKLIIPTKEASTAEIGTPPDCRLHLHAFTT